MHIKTNKRTKKTISNQWATDHAAFLFKEHSLKQSQTVQFHSYVFKEQLRKKHFSGGKIAAKNGVILYCN